MGINFLCISLIFLGGLIMSNVFEVKKDIYFTGVVDKDLEVFDIIMETEFGTTYNACLLYTSYYTSPVSTVSTVWTTSWNIFFSSK